MTAAVQGPLSANKAESQQGPGMSARGPVLGMGRDFWKMNLEEAWQKRFSSRKPAIPRLKDVKMESVPRRQLNDSDGGNPERTYAAGSSVSLDIS